MDSLNYYLLDSSSPPQGATHLSEWKVAPYPMLRYLLHLSGVPTTQPFKDDWIFKQEEESKEGGLLKQTIRTNGFKQILGRSEKWHILQRKEEMETPSGWKVTR